MQTVSIYTALYNKNGKAQTAWNACFARKQKRTTQQAVSSNCLQLILRKY